MATKPTTLIPSLVMLVAFAVGVGVMWQIDRYYALGMVAAVIVIFAPIALAVARSMKAQREVDVLDEKDIGGRVD